MPDPHFNPTEAAKLLAASRAPFDKLTAPAAPGIYAVYLLKPDALPPFTPAKEGLLYIAQSPDLAARPFDQHFDSKSTGFSTLRRSIGAILKTTFTLHALPRSAAHDTADFKNYRFNPAGEDRLTDWMKSHLEVALLPTPNPEHAEKLLLPFMKPLLNLKGWPNPQADALKALRKICSDEAKKSVPKK